MRAGAVWHEGESVPYPDLIKAHFGMVGGELIGHGEVRARTRQRLLCRGSGLLGGLHRRRRGRGRCRNRPRHGEQGGQRRRRRQGAQPASGRGPGDGRRHAGDRQRAPRGDALRSNRHAPQCDALRVPRPTIADMPDTFVSNIVENADGPGPYGAKGVGEGALAGVAAPSPRRWPTPGCGSTRCRPRPSAWWRWREAARGATGDDGERRRCKR